MTISPIAIRPAANDAAARADDPAPPDRAAAALTPVGRYTPEPAYHPAIGLRPMGNASATIDGGGAVSFSQDTGGKSAHPVDRDLALISSDVYAQQASATGAAGDGVGGTSGNWHRLTDAELEAAGFDPNTMDSVNGFKAEVYTDGERYVLAFAGTDGPGDAVADVDQLYGESAQYEQAVQLAQTAKAAFGDDLVMTGHSLGGGLATVAALATGTTAVTFNAAGVSDATFENLGLDPDVARAAASDGQVRAYVVDGEALSSIQNSTSLPDTVGAVVVLEDPTPVNLYDYMAVEDGQLFPQRAPTPSEWTAYETAQAQDALDDHSITTVIDAMG